MCITYITRDVCDGIEVPSPIRRREKSRSAGKFSDSVDSGIARAAVTDQAERERRHLAHFRIGIVQQRREQRHALREPDTPDRERRSTAHTRLGIGQQPAKVEIRR